MSFEVCPKCGHSDIQKNKPFVNAMHKYVNPATGKVDGVYNDDAPERMIQPKGSDKQIKLVRADVWEKQQAEKPKTPTAPATPAPKTPTPVLTK
jgi:hypothetical protein